MPASWSTAELGVLYPGDQPVHLRYLDTSGDKTDSSNTIIALHGVGFNSNIWNRWIPLLADTRLIALNRRGYSGSGPIHQPTGTTPQDPTEPWGRYVLDLVAFIKYTAEVLKVPPKRSDGTGGIVLLAWSKGNGPAISFLGLLSQGITPPFELNGIPRSAFEPYMDVIKSHLKSVILFEPPGVLVGIPLPESISGLWNMNTPPEERAKVFMAGCIGSLPEDAQPCAQQAAAIGDTLATGLDGDIMPAQDMKVVAQMAKIALENIPPWLSVGLIYGTGTWETCTDCAAWITPLWNGKPNTAIKILQGTGHFLMATDPEVFNTAVGGMMKQLEGLAQNPRSA
ncbi:hypothetical protein DACRYDRAFT_119715 [Dacryopinax primogenitus]|uniref:AB hydrolase-1 domain-containing protein n=1 Tax=Dacryopinax primogenitus (strain DJM 731) TaxID=1858805 RepID=M5FZG4_DACPD|nr:uncharacterized protein DACRYDRAFT_119715 [Dacryopinax primogenitus]EJT96892.1 hypothetical protein DACRYDRAFT_119715 [Dacryopinax primogenitus]